MTDDQLRQVYDAAYTESHAAGLRAVYEAARAELLPEGSAPTPTESTEKLSQSTEAPLEGASGG